MRMWASRLLIPFSRSLAFTNHALDETLKHVHKSVTENIVRCGSRSEDPALQAVSVGLVQKAESFAELAFVQISLHKLSEFSPTQASGTRAWHVGQKVKERKIIEEDILRLCAVAQRPTRVIGWHDLVDYLSRSQSPHLRALMSVPAQVLDIINENKEWTVAGKGKRDRQYGVPDDPETIFAFWRDGVDLDLFARQAAALAAERREMERRRRQAGAAADPALAVTNAFAALSMKSDEEGLPSPIATDLSQPLQSPADPPPPEAPDLVILPDLPSRTSDRTVGELLLVADCWSFSASERTRLVEYYAAAVVEDLAPRLRDLRRNLDKLNAEIKICNSEQRLAILSSASVIGATTNGCANVLDLIKKIRPTVLLVEEAGECLEAQVVANLVPSVQHLICIGDHLQLRPQITSYSLSIDSHRGKIHRHDVSLFERLADLPISMSVLQTQRRMRPEISKLIRNFLYPDLQDAPNVSEYPDVVGMRDNVWFVDHSLQEDEKSALHSSHTNTKEAQWVVDLVRHLVLQGSGRSIAVLTPYLGQVKILRNLLEAQQITTILDERDLGDLEAAQDDEDDDAEAIGPSPRARRCTLGSQVSLRTVDRFQGEEADVVVLSLVRNAATNAEDDDDEMNQAVFARKVGASIGFLKSPNRTNVAISRAKHGLYLFGSASLLRSKADIWESVVADLERDGLVAPSLGAVCPGHPGKTMEIDGPGQLPSLAPFGGCLEPCRCPLPCGHRCPQACHPIDNEVCAASTLVGELY